MSFALFVTFQKWLGSGKYALIGAAAQLGKLGFVVYFSKFLYIALS